jgi:hypothetical protein
MGSCMVEAVYKGSSNGDSWANYKHIISCFSLRPSLMHTFKDYVRMLRGDIYIMSYMLKLILLEKLSSS